MFKQVIPLFLTLLLFCCRANAISERSAREYTLKIWTVEDRLPGSPLTGLTQSRDGYIWLSTAKQLVRFNGVDFIALPVPDSVIEVTGSLDGVASGLPDGIWFFGEKGVGLFHRGEWSSWQVAGGPAVVGRILGLVISDDGVVRGYAERGLLEAITAEDDRSTRFEPRLCPVPSDDRATLGSITSADVDRRGRVWMTAWNGLVEYNQGGFDDKSMRLPDFLVEAVSGVHVGCSGRIWINGPNGIAYLENNIWTPVGFPENAGLASTILELSDGSLWIGNPTGIYRWSDGLWSHIGGSEMPAGMSVKQLIEDSDGTLWAACDSGLLNIRTRLVDKVHSDGMVTTGTAYSLCMLPGGQIWGGFQGLAVRLVPGSGRILQTIYLDVDLPVSAVLQDSKGDVWMGTLGGGLFKSTGMGYPGIVSQSDYSMPVVHTVYALLEDESLGVLVGTSSGLMRISDQGELEPAQIGNQTIQAAVHSLYRDRLGSLWICNDGLGVIGYTKAGEVRLINEASGLKGFARSVYLDSKDCLWIGTTAGLFYEHAESLYPVGRKISDFDQAVSHIAEDQFGRIWVSARNGLLALFFNSPDSLVSKIEFDYTKGARIIKVDVADGLPGQRALGSLGYTIGFKGGNLRESAMLFPFEGGICVVDPSRFMLSEGAPEVVVEQILVNGIKLLDNIAGPCRSVVLKPGVRNATVHFSALSPGGRSTVFYRYRVRGLHEGWSPVQRERTASFEWLPPGKYVLQIVACAGGLWSDKSVDLDFEVKAFFWQTIWFYIVLALLLAGVVFMIARRIMNQRYRLQMEMLRREEALHHERARISRDIHDDLGNGLSVIATLSELAHTDVERESIHKRLDQIYDVANELARNVDEIVWAVNPVNDSWDPFISYFEQYTEYFLGNSSMRFHFARPPDLRDVKVASKTRHHLLLAVRESIGNILKHAGATQVNISMTIQGAELVVTVADDGKGFDPSVDVGVGHNGLGNMRRRMKEINGSFDIDSTPGKGTKLTFRVEL